MECQTIRFLSQLPFPVSDYHYCVILRYSTNRWCCFSGGRSGGSRWDWDTDVGSRRRSRFSDAYQTDDYDEDDEFGFSKGAKQRIWWSDDSYEDDDDDDEMFGVIEGSIGLNWINKVFQAFGWMVPAVVISLLLGTGPNTIIMTLLLPLSQSVFSLVADALWGRPSDDPRPKTKSRKRPFSRATRNAWARRRKESDNLSGKRSGDYKSWMDASVEDEKSSTQNFGGWDELDNQVKVNQAPYVMAGEMENEPRVQERVKMRKRKKRYNPSVMQFLVAMFPFLGFWTKLL